MLQIPAMGNTGLTNSTFACDIIPRWRLDEDVSIYIYRPNAHHIYTLQDPLYVLMASHGYCPGNATSPSCLALTPLQLHWPLINYWKAGFAHVPSMCHPSAIGFEFSQCFFMIFTSHRYAPCIVTRMFGPRNMSRSWNRNQCQARTALQWGSYRWHNTRNHNTSPEQSRNGHDPSWLQHIATYCNVQTWLLNVFGYLLIPVCFVFPLLQVVISSR